MVFLGAWLHSSFTGYVRRYHKHNDRWSFWKVVLTRERYSDSAHIDVKCEVFYARKPNGRWVASRKPLVSREICLGNTNFDAKRMRTPSEAQNKNDPSVLKELQSAFEGIKRHMEIAADHQLGFRADELDVCIIMACLKQSESAAA